MKVKDLFSICENYFTHIYCSIYGIETYFYEDVYTFQFIYDDFKVLKFIIYEDCDQQTVLEISII